MTFQATLNDKPFAFTTENFPILITGICKSGASFFSVQLVAHLINIGHKVIFFTAYPMAKELLLELVSSDYVFEVTNKSLGSLPRNKSLLIESGNEGILRKTMDIVVPSKEYIIFIKNFESYDSSLYELIKSYSHLAISGNLDVCAYQDKLANFPRKSKIFFSSTQIFPGENIPQLAKYESYLTSRDTTGIIRLQK